MNTASDATKQTPVRLDFLDALRGLAALYVMVYHMVLLPQPNPALPRWAEMVAHNGGMGVTLFFVVSAFSLFFTMPLRLREPWPWVSFFLHRFFRIAPLFYAWILLTLWRDHWYFGASHGWREIAASASFLFNLIPQGQQGFVWASWTIGIEMLFYAVFPLFYLYARNRWQAISLTLGLLIGWTIVQGLVPYFPSDPTSQQMFLKWTFLRHLPVFACGAIAYHLLLEQGKLIDKPRDFAVALMMLAAAILLALVNGWLPPIFGDLYYWQAIAFLLFLIGLGWAPVKLVVNGFTTFLGRISYSFYLSHPTVILLISPAYGWIYRHHLGLTASFLACFLLTLATVICVSEITYRLVELPGMQLGKKLNLRIRSSGQQLMATTGVSGGAG
jgi:peptidoglycan/LPS O-acetylase OafA/YrhL